ncbi:Xanthosine operon regulatory protein XapR, LysR family [Citrobacter freundii]|uniref:Xanthosine operon regulatory protein XapR, LysR family n=1 Tax=Citrobacter freundii TaxID=546 RepID=A0A7G2IUQ5_CITFR|nr:Xanthosine operon regulatory protein XapR, LysR family [Citrobacter freundii]
MPAMQMTMLERRELDAGIWRMATEPSPGFTSLRLHESSFLVAIPEEHALTACESVPLEALRNEYFCHDALHSYRLGIFAASLPERWIFPDDYP